MKKTSKKVIAVTLSASMLLGGSMTAMAATTNPDISQREIDHKTAAKNIAAQGMVLMENKNNSLPISAKKGTKVALFGQGVYNTIKGGTGSGAVNQRDNVTVQQGFENAGYDIVNADFVNQMHELWTANGGGTSQGWGFKWVNEPVYEQTRSKQRQIRQILLFMLLHVTQVKDQTVLPEKVIISYRMMSGPIWNCLEKHLIT